MGIFNLGTLTEGIKRCVGQHGYQAIPSNYSL